MPDDAEKKPGTLIGNPPVKNPPPEPTHLTLEEVADEPAPVRPVTQPLPLADAIPPSSEAAVQEALNRVAAPAPPAKAAPPKAARAYKQVVISVMTLSVVCAFTFAVIAIVIDSCGGAFHNNIKKPRAAAPLSVHTTKLPEPAPPVLICDEKSVVTVATDHMDFTGCRWSPPLSASTPPRTLYCDDTNSPTVMLDGSVRFTDCKPK